MHTHKISEVLDFLVYSNIYIAFAAASYAYLLFKVFDMSINYILIIPPIITFAIYTINRKTDKKEDAINNSKKRDFTIKYSSTLFTIALILYGTLIIWSLIRGVSTVVMILMPFIMGLLYSKKWILSKSGYVRLKDMFFTKNIVVAVTVTYMTILLPALLLKLPFSQNLYFLGFIVFSQVLINTIFLDIKDKIGDAMCGIKTMPVLYGISFTEKVLIFLNITYSYLIITAHYLWSYSPLLFYIGLFSAAYSFFYMLLYKAKIMEINNLSYVIADGESILLAIYAYLLH